MPYDKRKAQQISVRIEHELWKRLEEYYKKRGEDHLSMNDMVLGCLKRCLNNAEENESMTGTQDMGGGKKKRKGA